MHAAPGQRVRSGGRCAACAWRSIPPRLRVGGQKALQNVIGIGAHGAEFQAAEGLARQGRPACARRRPVRDRSGAAGSRRTDEQGRQAISASVAIDHVEGPLHRPANGTHAVLDDIRVPRSGGIGAAPASIKTPWSTSDMAQSSDGAPTETILAAGVSQLQKIRPISPRLASFRRSPLWRRQGRKENRQLERVEGHNR
jgi:hypothetical protein